MEHSAHPRSPGATVSGVRGPLMLKPPELKEEMLPLIQPWVANGAMP